MNELSPFPGVFIGWNFETGVHNYISGLWVGKDTSQGGCALSGDSGGPVYRHLSDGTVAAVGITSGYMDVAGGCASLFTPVSDALNQFGGSIKVGS